MIDIHPQRIKIKNNKAEDFVLIPQSEFDKMIEELEELEDIRLYDEGKNDNESAIPKDKAMAMIEAERKKSGK
jgi:PHD/YefM family antitoxin component YafN of YafNO toxin-antitoxin module